MKIHGSVRIVRRDDGGFAATFRPLGGMRATGPGLALTDRRALESFLVGRLLLARRDALEAVAAVARNGSYALPGLWLRDDEIEGLGLGRAAGHDLAGGGDVRGGAGYTSTGATTPMRAARSGPSLFSPASAATL
jgi:hypothetical protein